MDVNEFLNILFESLNRYFSLDEIRTICFNMGIDYDSIPGEAKSAKTRELIQDLARNQRLRELLDLVTRYRPRVAWPPMPENFQLSSSLEWASSSQTAQSIQYGDVIHGSKIDGDYVGRDKIGGDKISVGNISGSTGIAIGRGANATVHQGVTGESMASLFAPLQRLIYEQSPGSIGIVNDLKEQVALGSDANDKMVARMVQVLASEVPKAKLALVSLFQNPAVSQSAGPITEFALEMLVK